MRISIHFNLTENLLSTIFFPSVAAVIERLNYKLTILVLTLPHKGIVVVVVAAAAAVVVVVVVVDVVVVVVIVIAFLVKGLRQ